MQDYNDRIVQAARGWIGTRFHHQGRVKKTSSHRGGVDCLGLLIGVAKELRLEARCGTPLAALDDTAYPHSPDTIRLQQVLRSALQEIPVGGIEAGDVVLLRVEDSPQHLAIVSSDNERLGIIHAYAPARAVVEHALDTEWNSRIEGAFRYLHPY